MKKIVLVLAFFVLSFFNVACADSASSGFELNKTTFDEAVKKHSKYKSNYHSRKA